MQRLANPSVLLSVDTTGSNVPVHAMVFLRFGDGPEAVYISHATFEPGKGKPAALKFDPILADDANGNA